MNTRIPSRSGNDVGSGVMREEGSTSKETRLTRLQESLKKLYKKSSGTN
jgi:hypothetical protein